MQVFRRAWAHPAKRVSPLRNSLADGKFTKQKGSNSPTAEQDCKFVRQTKYGVGARNIGLLAHRQPTNGGAGVIIRRNPTVTFAFTSNTNTFPISNLTTTTHCNKSISPTRQPWPPRTETKPVSRPLCPLLPPPQLHRQHGPLRRSRRLLPRRLQRRARDSTRQSDFVRAHCHARRNAYVTSPPPPFSAPWQILRESGLTWGIEGGWQHNGPDRWACAWSTCRAMRRTASTTPTSRGSGSSIPRASYRRGTFAFPSCSAACGSFRRVGGNVGSRQFDACWWTWRWAAGPSRTVPRTRPRRWGTRVCTSRAAPWGNSWLTLASTAGFRASCRLRLLVTRPGRAALARKKRASRCVCVQQRGLKCVLNPCSLGTE